MAKSDSDLPFLDDNLTPRGHLNTDNLAVSHSSAVSAQLRCSVDGLAKGSDVFVRIRKSEEDPRGAEYELRPFSRDFGNVNQDNPETHRGEIILGQHSFSIVTNSPAKVFDFSG